MNAVMCIINTLIEFDTHTQSALVNNASMVFAPVRRVI